MCVLSVQRAVTAGRGGEGLLLRGRPLDILAGRLRSATRASSTPRYVRPVGPPTPDGAHSLTAVTSHS